MQKPILVASVPRACSTAFERVFMTRPDLFKCHHEPFGDAYYYGPERLGARFDGDSLEAIKSREESGFSKTTYKDVLEGLLAPSGTENEQKRAFIKDMAYYIIPPAGKVPRIAPSLKNSETQASGAKTSVSSQTGMGISGAIFSYIRALVHWVFDVQPTNGKNVQNPTVLPTKLLQQFQFTFLIRHPSRAIPSYYRCTVPPLAEVTGFRYFDPAEAGFRETRLLIEYLMKAQLLRKDDVILIDADDLLNNPEGIIRKYCERVGVDFSLDMLKWEEDECEDFEKWKGFHADAIKSKGLIARRTPARPKSDEECFQEWVSKYGEEGARLIQDTVKQNLEHYEWLKAFKVVI